MLEIVSKIVLRHQDLKTTQVYLGEVSKQEAIGRMLERAYALEGTFEIKGVQGKGTTVTVSVPLCEDEERNITTMKRGPKKIAEEV